MRTGIQSRIRRRSRLRSAVALDEGGAEDWMNPRESNPSSLKRVCSFPLPKAPSRCDRVAVREQREGRWPRTRGTDGRLMRGPDKPSIGNVIATAAGKAGEQRVCPGSTTAAETIGPAESAASSGSSRTLRSVRPATRRSCGYGTNHEIVSGRLEM